MGQGSFVICEMDSVAKQNPVFQRAMKTLETKAVNYCTEKWFPKKTPQEAFGYLTPQAGKQFGRTTILPALFRTGSTTAHGQGQFGSTTPAIPALDGWRQLFRVPGNQELIVGSGMPGTTIPEDFIIAWAGLAFPNKNQHITELKWQIGDRKYGRVNIEEMWGYNKPAIIFEEGFTIDEEESFHLWGYVEGPLPVHHDGEYGDYQRIVMLGFANYKIISKVLGQPGSIIT